MWTTNKECPHEAIGFGWESGKNCIAVDVMGVWATCTCNLCSQGMFKPKLKYSTLYWEYTQICTSNFMALWNS